MSASSCIFCQIISETMPAHFVYRDEWCTAFMDIHPVNPGHVLIVPNRHIERFYDLEKNVAEHLMGVAQDIYQAVRNTSVRCEGANLFLSDGAEAGQDVKHTHLHVAPRFAGDKHRPGFLHSDPDAAEQIELERIAKELRGKILR